MAIVLCALAASIYLLIERRNPFAMLRQRWPWQVVAIAVAIGAVWYVPAAIVGGHKIVRIIFAENFGHFMPARLGGTGESYRPFYFIAARLLGGAFPMTLLILPAALAFYTGEISAEKRRAGDLPGQHVARGAAVLLDRQRQARRLHPARASGDRDSVRVGVRLMGFAVGGEVARRDRRGIRVRSNFRRSFCRFFPATRRM